MEAIHFRLCPPDHGHRTVRTGRAEILAHVGPPVGDEAKDVVGRVLPGPYGGVPCARAARVRRAGYREKELPMCSRLGEAVGVTAIGKEDPEWVLGVEKVGDVYRARVERERISGRVRDVFLVARVRISGSRSDPCSLRAVFQLGNSFTERRRRFFHFLPESD